MRERERERERENGDLDSRGRAWWTRSGGGRRRRRGERRPRRWGGGETAWSGRTSWDQVAPARRLAFPETPPAMPSRPPLFRPLRTARHSRTWPFLLSSPFLSLLRSGLPPLFLIFYLSKVYNKSLCLFLSHSGKWRKMSGIFFWFLRWEWEFWENVLKF